MRTFFYDIECYQNLFLVVLLDAACPQALVDKYIEADIAKDYTLKRTIRDSMPFKIITVTHSVNEIMRLYDIFVENTLVIGFNNKSYDDTLINYITAIRNTIDVSGKVRNFDKTTVQGKVQYTSVHITKVLKGISDEIISSREYWTHPNYTNNNLKRFRAKYFSLDFFRCIFDHNNRKGLKQALINANWYRIEDLPLPHDALIKDTEVDAILDYCINDVIGLRHLFLLEGEEIGLRFSIGAEYGYNFLASNRSNIADKLFMTFYSQQSGIDVRDLKDLRTYHTSIPFKDILSPKIHFDNPIFAKLFDKIYNHTYRYGKAEIDEIVYVNNTGYNLKLGGMHSTDRVGVFHTYGNDMILEDEDVGSFYPQIGQNEGSCPKHLNPKYYLPLGGRILKERLELKAKGFVTKATAYKIILNVSLFGKLGDKNSFLKDDAVKFSVTLNGQFFLLMLVERLEAKGIHVISANTDGIVSYYPKHLTDVYRSISEEWCKELGFTLEYTPYEKYVRRDVNNYMAIKVGFKQAIADGIEHSVAEKKYVKCKGFFDTNVDIKKGYKTQIISKAVKDYYLYGVMPEDTINKCKNIYDFLIAQKIDNHTFELQAIGVFDGEVETEILQAHTRFYISNTGVALIKKEKYGKRKISLASHRYCTYFNNYIRYDDFTKYDINLNYYIAQAYDVLHILSNQKQKGTKNVVQKYNSEQGLFDFNTE
jgi:hypothetical protein